MSRRTSKSSPYVVPSLVSRRGFLLTGTSAAALLAVPDSARALIPGAHGRRDPWGHAAAPPVELAATWIRQQYDLVKREKLSVTAAARFYANMGVVAYEAVLGGTRSHRTLAGQLAGLKRHHRPELRRPTHPLDPAVMLATATCRAVPALIPQLGSDTQAALRATLRAAVQRAAANGAPPHLIHASMRRGRKVAAWVTSWSNTDGYRESLARPYPEPQGPGLWERTPPALAVPVGPHFEEVRLMVARSTDEAAPSLLPPPFSTASGSDFRHEAEEVARWGRKAPGPEAQIGYFWSDAPGVSGGPSGHWLLLVAQLASARSLTFAQALEAYTRTSIALHDAFICCWDWKYRVNLIRPVSYIQRHLDRSWAPLFATPPFPEFPSGHSTGSYAAATVLTQALGTFAYSEQAPPGVSDGAPRHFRSFYDAAAEAAQSRLYAGIHFPTGIAAGEQQGRRVGALVNRRLRTHR